MAHRERSALDKLEEKGFWWSPDKPEKRIPGTLTHDESETRLELFGDLTASTGARSAADYWCPIILGVDSRGELYTLLRNHCLDWSGLLTGLELTTWQCDGTLLVGRHFETEEEVLFTSMSINYSDLEAWVDQPEFEAASHEMEGNRLIRHQSTLRAS